MRFKLRQPDARRRYARRKAIVEPVFGQLKEARGFTTLSLRGLARAAGEYLLACLAHNLGKLLRVCPLPGRATNAAGGLISAPGRSPHRVPSGPADTRAASTAALADQTALDCTRRSAGCSLLRLAPADP